MKTSLETAIYIVETLRSKGHTALFAGGWVRDYLLNISSSDIDIATTAEPAEVESYFEHTYPVGANFGVILVRFDETCFEVATFRQDEDYLDGRHPEKISFSNPKEDALRRDFTINGMFYDPIEDKILDYVEGKKDLKLKIIRAIGNPKMRFKEDRLRMLRAIRFASKFQFKIAPSTELAISTEAHSLFPSVSIERVWQEISKMAEGAHFFEAMHSLKKLNLVDVIFPESDRIEIHSRALENVDLRGAPELCFLLLYPKLDRQFIKSICQFFKLSRANEKTLTDCFLFLRACKSNETANHTWVNLYAHPSYERHIQLAKSLSEHTCNPNFIQDHSKRINTLSPYIERVIHKKPLICAQDLFDLGVRPGKKIGELLDFAFKLSTDRLIHDKTTLIKAIKEQI